MIFLIFWENNSAGYDEINFLHYKPLDKSLLKLDMNFLWVKTLIKNGYPIFN